MPPSAFQNRNVGQRIWFIPASHADAIRRPATQRPRKTAFGPCLAKNGSPCSSTFRRCVVERARAQRTAGGRSGGRSRSRRCRRGSPRPRRATISVPMSIWPSVGEQRGGDQRGLAGHRDAHRLDRDQREDARVADVRRDVDQGARAPESTAIALPRRWRSGSSPARARTRCRASRAAGRSRSHTPWGEALVSRGHVGGRRRAAHLAPRRGPPAALQPRHAPREHRRAAGSSARPACSR